MERASTAGQAPVCWDLPGREAQEAGRSGMRGSVCAHTWGRDMRGPASAAGRLPARAACLRPPSRALRDGEAWQHRERCSSFMPCLFVFFFFFLGVDPSALNNLNVSGRSGGGFQYVSSVSATSLCTGLVFHVLQRQESSVRLAGEMP